MKTKIVILGAGPGGYVAAVRAAQQGGDVTIIEKENVGGTCLNWGCIPSKIYKQTADTLETFKRASEFCISDSVCGQVNLSQLQARTTKIIEQQSKGIHGLLKKHSISFIHGTGTLSSNNTVTVTHQRGDTTTVEFDKLILATGSSPTPLPFLPFDGKNILSSNDIFRLKNIPETITIIGGGVIGCEFACILSSFGCKVTVVEGLDRLLPLPSVDKECSKLLLREMKKKKIKVELNTTLKSANDDGTLVRMELCPVGNPESGKIKILETEKVLVCIGRKSNNYDVGLATAGVEHTERGWVITDQTLVTSNPNIYAIGDALGPEKIMLAHTASTEAEIAAENCFGANKKMDSSVMPSGIFTTPEIGCVGLSQEQAEEQFGAQNIRHESALFRTLGKAQVLGELAGQAKIICEKESGKIVGVHIAGPHATDLLGEATLAIKRGVTAQQLAETIHAHPTLPEIMLETAFKLTDIPLHG